MIQTALLAGTAEAGSSMSLFLPLVAMVVLMYFMLWRPQKKKERESKLMLNSLKPGDEVVTIGGFVGKILSVKEDEIILETGASKTKLTMKKWSIQQRLSPQQPDEDDDDEYEYEDDDEEEVIEPKKRKSGLFSKKDGEDNLN